MVSIGPLLRQHRFAEARPLLETLLQLQPDHPEALYNLGVLASEEGKPEEARLLLRRAVVANAGEAHAQANAQVALADRLLLQVIEVQPSGELANKANNLRGGIAARDLRSAQPEGLRQDAVSGDNEAGRRPRGLTRSNAVSSCLQALQLFEGMDQQRFMAVLSEVAAVGQGGLQISEPGTARSLKNLPGSWSDLALACLIHVGMWPQARRAVAADAGSGLRAGDRGGIPGGGAVAWGSMA